MICSLTEDNQGFFGFLVRRCASLFPDCFHESCKSRVQLSLFRLLSSATISLKCLSRMERREVTWGTSGYSLKVCPDHCGKSGRKPFALRTACQSSFTVGRKSGPCLYSMRFILSSLRIWRVHCFATTLVPPSGGAKSPCLANLLSFLMGHILYTGGLPLPH